MPTADPFPSEPVVLTVPRHVYVSSDSELTTTRLRGSEAKWKWTLNTKIGIQIDLVSASSRRELDPQKFQLFRISTFLNPRDHNSKTGAGHRTIQLDKNNLRMLLWAVKVETLCAMVQRGRNAMSMLWDCLFRVISEVQR